MTPAVLSASFWEANPAFLLVTVAALALVVGSFLNVVILRLPLMMERAWRRECAEAQTTQPRPQVLAEEPLSLAFPPSRCPHCGHRLRPWENIPVLSFVVLRGRCSACSGRISVRYPVVELLTLVLSLAVVLRFGVQWQAAAGLVFTWALLAGAIIDLDEQLLPDAITLPLLWLGLVLNTQGLMVPLPEAVWGAVFGYLSLWSVYWMFKLVTGKEGMGYGDFKLLAAIGAWLGWQALPTVILLSSACGAVIGIALIVWRGRDRRVPMPFGPFLAAAGWLTLFLGNQVLAG